MGHYLVTGAAGFIGSRTAELLLDLGHTVTGVDNLSGDYDVKLKEYRVQRLQMRNGFSLRRIDITEFSAVSALFSESSFDAVLHLAGKAGVRYSMQNPHIYMDVNARGTLNILEGMRMGNTRHIVLASTSSLYAGHTLPFREEHPVNQPISVYAASKKAAEVMCFTYHHQFNFNVAIVRYFTVYGPAGRPDMSPFRFIKWTDEGHPIPIYGDGHQSRDFTYIDDIARGTIAASRVKGCEIFNLGGGGTPRSLREMIAIIEGLANRKAQLVFEERHCADMAETQADITKARSVLGWNPSVSLEDGLARAYSWYKDNQNWASTIAV